MKNLEPEIVVLEEKKIEGIFKEMSLVQNKTRELWMEFGPQIKNVLNKKTTDKISMQLYPEGYFKSFNPTTTFTKWAGVEVSSFENSSLDEITIPEGLYAKFHYKGSSADSSIFEYIFGVWIPNSNYNIDDRPHFEVLGEKYKNNDPSSEEEIWIPIKEK